MESRQPSELRAADLFLTADQGQNFLLVPVQYFGHPVHQQFVALIVFRMNPLLQPMQYFKLEYDSIHNIVFIAAFVIHRQ